MDTRVDGARWSTMSVSAAGSLFDPGTGYAYTLNPVAVAIITAWKADESPDRLRAALLERFEVDARTLERDLMEFMRRVKWLGLVT